MGTNSVFNTIDRSANHSKIHFENTSDSNPNYDSLHSSIQLDNDSIKKQHRQIKSIELGEETGTTADGDTLSFDKQPG